MAQKYIDIIKIAEDDLRVVYRYSISDGRPGLVVYDKVNRDFAKLVSSGPEEPKDVYFAVKHRLNKSFREGNFPDKDAYVG